MSPKMKTTSKLKMNPKLKMTSKSKMNPKLKMNPKMKMTSKIKMNPLSNIFRYEVFNTLFPEIQTRNFHIDNFGPP